MARNMWGILPDQALTLLRKREWDHLRHLKQRFNGQRRFPIEISLKTPKGEQALENLAHFHGFYQAWHDFAFPELVEWQTLKFRQLGEQHLPVKLSIPSLALLAQVLGQQQRLQQWTTQISTLLHQEFVPSEYEHALYLTLIDHLEQLEQYSSQEWQLLIQLIAQLKPDLGAGLYLRALPLQHVDTKFLEKNIRLVEAICDVLQGGEVCAQGGLLAWLNCLDQPKGWLMIKPLCTQVQQQLGNLPIFQLSSDILRGFELPARHIFIVENIQAGLAIPPLENSIVVCGGGKNISWLDAEWLNSKQVYYWGDIDSEGLNILSLVRHKVAHVQALMMDLSTVLKFQDKMVDEPDSVRSDPTHLNTKELDLFRQLRADQYTNRRLEQERISVSWISQSIMKAMHAIEELYVKD